MSGCILGKRCGSSNRSDTQIISTQACQKRRVKGRSCYSLGSHCSTRVRARQQPDSRVRTLAIIPNMCHGSTCGSSANLQLLNDMMFWVKVLERLKVIVQSPNWKIVISQSSSCHSKPVCFHSLCGKNKVMHVWGNLRVGTFYLQSTEWNRGKLVYYSSIALI